MHQRTADKLAATFSYDRDAAARELDQASVKTATIAVQAGDATEVTLATLVQEAAAGVGLTIEIKQLQPLQFSSAFYDPAARQGIDFLLTFGYMTIPDPLEYLTLGPVPGGQFNMIGYEDPVVTSNIAEARRTTDDARRAELITEAMARFDGEAWAIPLLNLREALFLGDRVTGAPVSFAYLSQPSLALVGAK